MSGKTQIIFPSEIVSVATAFPKNIRTNDFWEKNYPEVVAKTDLFMETNLWGTIEEVARASSTEIFHKHMLKYMKDPFRGCKERRVLAKDEENIQFEAMALERALKAAKLTLKDIDLM